MTIKNRATRARQQAGLSIGQAAKLLPLDREELVRIETDDDAYAAAGHRVRQRMAEVYMVDPAWMNGETDLRDYDAIKDVRGADDITNHDRDILAEFAASMPKGGEPRSREILACKRAIAMASNPNPDGEEHG